VIPEGAANTTHGQVAPRSEDREEQPLVSQFSEWTETLGLRLRGSVRLALAETKLAFTTFVMMICLVVLAAGALILAWALLLVAAVQALALAGLQLLASMIVVAGLHVLLAWGLWRLANRLSKHMEFRATRKMLKS
jgi:uncharacterized membrane protein YqjE